MKAQTTVTVNIFCEKHQTRCDYTVAEGPQFLHNGADAYRWASERPNRIHWDASCTDDYGNAGRRTGTILRHRKVN